MVGGFNEESCRRSLMRDFDNYIATTNMAQTADEFTMRYWTANGVAQSIYMLGLISVSELTALNNRLFWETWSHRYALIHSEEEAC